MRRALPIVLVLGAAASARAQRGIDTEIVKPAMDGYGILGTERARTSRQYDFGLQLQLGYAQNPLRLNLVPSGQAMAQPRNVAVVDSTATFHLGVHAGLTDWLELAFDMPVVRQSLDPTGFGVPQSSSGAPTGFFQVSPGTNIRPSEVSPGDMRWALKLEALRRGGIALGGEVIATLPFGDETAFLGTHSFTVEPLAILDFTLGRVAVALNAGYRWHDGKDFVLDPTVVARSKMDPSMVAPVALTDTDEIVGSLGATVRVYPSVALALSATHLEPVRPPEIVSRLPGATHGDRVTHVLGGIQVRVLDFTIAVGGGAGVVSAARQDDFTLLAGLSWVPEGETTALGPDGDHDGVPDAQDLCRDDPEDRDGYQDEDGCPDPDNDGDGIPDDKDRCPNEPEDLDGYQDADGCPDPDNDGDGVLDVQDRCPNEPEDRDGFEDEDGCPDPDNDGDGIPDARDHCPNEPETFNGLDDEDGCPDFVAGGASRFQIAERVLFKEQSARLEPAMTRLLDDIAGRLRRHPQLSVIRVEGHAASAGSVAFQQRISQARAGAVREYLIQQGVGAARLQSVGYGARRPTDTNATREGRARNCRVEIIVVE